MNDPEAARAYAQVLLDGVSAMEDGGTDEMVQLACQRALQLNILQVSFDNETDLATVDLTDVIGPALVLAVALVSMAAEARGESKDVVIADARHAVTEGLSQQ